MGWDAFGLPAENAAIKMKTNPAKLIAQYSANYKRQFRLIGISFDWSRRNQFLHARILSLDPVDFLELYNAWYYWCVNAARLAFYTLIAELGKTGTTVISNRKRSRGCRTME